MVYNEASYPDTHAKAYSNEETWLLRGRLRRRPPVQTRFGVFSKVGRRPGTTRLSRHPSTRTNGLLRPLLQASTSKCTDSSALYQSPIAIPNEEAYAITYYEIHTTTAAYSRTC